MGIAHAVSRVGQRTPIPAAADPLKRRWASAELQRWADSAALRQGVLMPRRQGRDEMTTRASVDRFLAEENLVLVGASRSGKRFGNIAFTALTHKGYSVSLVHPTAGDIGGVKCYRSISDLPEPVGGLVVVVPPDQTERVVNEAISNGIKNIWMQQGAESPDAVKACHESGINEVHGECILMFAKPSGGHKLHRWIRGLLGKLPK